MNQLTGRFAVVALCFAISGEASAALIRNGGSTYQQDTDVKYGYLMEDSNIVADGVIHEANAFVSTYSLASTQLAAYATPPSDCYHSIFGTPEGEFRTACHWQYAQGETMQFHGAVSTYLPGSLYQFLWTITGPTQSWSFSGADVLFNGFDVFLNVAMPQGMVPGEYTVGFSFTQTAPDNQFFLLRDRDWRGGCIDDEYQVCGYFGTMVEELGTGASARLVITDTPEVLVLLITGLFGLYSVRRKIAKQH